MVMFIDVGWVNKFGFLGFESMVLSFCCNNEY